MKWNIVNPTSFATKMHPKMQKNLISELPKIQAVATSVFGALAGTIKFVVDKVPVFEQWFRMPNMREDEGYIETLKKLVEKVEKML